jgi:hypothetical protein
MRCREHLSPRSSRRAQHLPEKRKHIFQRLKTHSQGGGFLCHINVVHDRAPVGSAHGSTEFFEPLSINVAVNVGERFKCERKARCCARIKEEA